MYIQNQADSRKNLIRIHLYNILQPIVENSIEIFKETVFIQNHFAIQLI